MAHKGITSGSLGAYETSPAWHKRQKKKTKRYEEYCKRKSGPATTTRTGSPEKHESIPRDIATNQHKQKGSPGDSK